MGFGRVDAVEHVMHLSLDRLAGLLLLLAALLGHFCALGRESGPPPLSCHRVSLLRQRVLERRLVPVGHRLPLGRMALLGSSLPFGVEASQV
jgi:hypothetical protein